MKARIGPLGKLDCFYSKKKYVQLKNDLVQTGFRGGPTEPSIPATCDLQGLYHKFRPLKWVDFCKARPWLVLKKRSVYFLIGSSLNQVPWWDPAGRSDDQEENRNRREPEEVGQRRGIPFQGRTDPRRVRPSHSGFNFCLQNQIIVFFCSSSPTTRFPPARPSCLSFPHRLAFLIGAW